MKPTPLDELKERLALEHNLHSEVVYPNELEFEFVPGTDSFKLILDLDKDIWRVQITPTNPNAEFINFSYGCDMGGAIKSMLALKSYYDDVVMENCKNF